MKNTAAAPNLLSDLSALPNVEKVAKFGNRVMVKFPRELGGSSIMTIPEAKKLLARLSSR